MIKCKINNIEYIINDGFILRDKYSEELDSGMITIPFSDKLDLSPFDFVELEDERFGKKYFLIDTWTEDVVSFKPLKYNYNISLISETIKLQKVVMPNLAITQRIGGYIKDIKLMLDRYNDLYVYPQYPELTTADRFTPFTIDELCPETLFNRPTAFEVYNTLLAKKNAVVKINNHKIDYIRLDQYGKAIDENKLYYVTDTQNIEDYANRLDTQVNNGVSNTNNFYSISGLTVRGGEGDAVMSDDNMAIVLDKPIYDLDSIGGIYVKFPVRYEYGSSFEREINITSKVVEKSVYDTYLVSNDIGVITDNNYKRNALYYVRGSNMIEGLAYNDKYIVGESRTAIYNILKASLEDYPTVGENPVILDFNESNVKDVISFRIKYKTSESYRVNVEKENKYNATLIDNQTETQVDSNNFGKVEQDKLNRLGNKTKIITATYYKDEIIPELGDYIGEYVLAEREIVYYDDYALFKGYLYKDYVRKNLFYGLNSKKRSTQIETESVIRNEVVNYNLSFGIEREQEASNTGSNYYELKRYILYPLMLSNSSYSNNNNFIGEYDEFPKYAMISVTSSLDENLVQGGGWLLLTPSTYSSGKSNIIHLQFKDNFSAGMRLTDSVEITDRLWGNVGGRKQEYVKYVDNYGEFRKIYISFYTNKIDDAYYTTKEIADSLPLLPYNAAGHLSNGMNHIFNTGTLELWKDNRETIAISVNLNYKDSPNVIIGNFAEKTGVVYHHIINRNIGICYSKQYEYEVGDTYGIGNLVTDNSVSLDSSNGEDWLNSQLNNTTPTYGAEFDTLSLLLNNVDISEWKSWGIVDKETNELILGVNRGNEKTMPTKIYLKCTKKDY